MSKDQSNIYPKYRDFSRSSETQFQLIVDFFKERRDIETGYAQALHKLGKKYEDVAELSDSCTVSQAFLKTVTSSSTLAAEHLSLAIVLADLTKILSESLTIYQKSSKSVRSALKSAAREYTDERESLYKAKDAFVTASEVIQSHSEKKTVVSPEQIQKSRQELARTEKAYRDHLQKLELLRMKLDSCRDMASQEGRQQQAAKTIVVSQALKRHATAEKQVSHSRTTESELLMTFTECIKVDVDTEVFASEFERVFPKPSRVYFEAYRKNSIMPANACFGLPLLNVPKNREGIPLVLEKLVSAVEERGLEVEGIYRLSGRQSEIKELKSLLEETADNVDLLDPKVDIHAISGLVKLFLRELPDPTFPIPKAERLDYVNISDTAVRVKKLQDIYAMLPTSHKKTILFLTLHLKKVSSHAQLNKMSLENLSVVFTTALFGSVVDDEPEGNTGGSSFFSWMSQKTESKTSMSLDLQLQKYDFLKKDCLFEDVMQHSDEIFG